MPTRQELLELEELDALEARMGASGKTSMVDNVIEKVKYLPEFLGQSARKMGASAMGTYEGLAKTAEKLPGNSGLMLKTFRALTEKPREQGLKKLDVPDDPMAGDDEQFYNKMLRGAGGQLALPVPGVGVAANTLPGAVGGGAGEAARRYAEGISPKLAPYGELAGNVLGAGTTGFLLGPKLKLHEIDIHDALKNTSPQGFRDAANRSAAQTAAGAKTNTAAEAFPERSAIMDLADQTRGGNIDNALRTRLENRPQDLKDLGTEFLARISSSQKSPNQIANDTSTAANAYYEGSKGVRNETMRTLYAGKNADARDVVGTYSQMHAMADKIQRPGEREAFQKVADALVGADKTPLRSLQDVSLALVELKKAASNPMSLIRSGGVVGEVDLNKALNFAINDLSRRDPTLKNALTYYGNYGEKILEPLKKSPIGSLSDKNPNNTGQTPVSRLDRLLVNNSPQEIKNTATALSLSSLPKSKMGEMQNISPEDLAKAIAQNKLQLAPTDPGRAMRGESGSSFETNFEALLTAGNKNPNYVNAPLKAADELQRFNSVSGIFTPPKMGFGQMLIRPFRTLDMALTSGKMERVNKATAELLADPANLPELQRIAMFNPQLRRALGLRGVITAPMSQQE